MIILKVTKNQGFTLSIEDKLLELAKDKNVAFFAVFFVGS